MLGWFSFCVGLFSIRSCGLFSSVCVSSMCWNCLFDSVEICCCFSFGIFVCFSIVVVCVLLMCIGSDRKCCMVIGMVCLICMCCGIQLMCSFCVCWICFEFGVICFSSVCISVDLFDLFGLIIVMIFLGWIVMLICDSIGWLVFGWLILRFCV